jgi:predicted phosphodiesterase
VLQIVRTATRDFEDIQKNIARMVAGLQRIQSQIATTESPEPAEDAVRILVVADIQNNPVGLLIGQELVRRFEVDGVIDAGDFTDQGTDLEGELFRRFSGVKVPYVIAPGNHEDEAALAKVREIPTVTILDAEAGRDVAEIEGLAILGDRDPMSGELVSDPDTEKSEREIPIRCRNLAQRFEETQPTVLIVHRREMGECAAERAVESQTPLVFVWGHLHEQSYEEKPYLVSVSPGTSGANGIKTPTETPYGFSLLEFDPSTRLLESTCQFQFDGPNALRQAACHLHPEYGSAEATP